MEIKVLETKIICKNRDSVHNYFGWPTVCKLQDGRLAMVASGFRVAHICPFGTAVICFSEDEGETWSKPVPIISTPLDDRDGGICTFGDKGVIVTSFNNKSDSLREWIDTDHPLHKKNEFEKKYISAYLDIMESKFKDEDKYYGSTFVMSHDGGKSFDEEISFIPVTAPHGPCLLPDGNLLYVGENREKHIVESYKVYPDGTYEKLGEIENIIDGVKQCEPYAVVLESGKVIVHLRMNKSREYFTLAQCESDDFGKTFTKPHFILDNMGGAPSHMMVHSSGMLICAYGYRRRPDFGVKLMFSHDNGETWVDNQYLYKSQITPDLGYPSTIELSDGTMLTTFYAHETDESPAEIFQTKWKIEF